jgi:hypothetical protein
MLVYDLARNQLAAVARPQAPREHQRRHTAFGKCGDYLVVL